MQQEGQHHVACIDETVTTANLHERAEAIAVPDFDYVQQGIDAVVSGLARHGHRSQHGSRLRSADRETKEATRRRH
jgi:hypothetical protein